MAFGRVLLGMVLLLVVLEVGTRKYLFSSSKDFARFSHYPEQARTLATAPGFRIAVFGNSTTECGVDPDMLQTALAAQSTVPLTVKTFTADASRVNTWYYMVTHYFGQQRPPELIVIPYCGFNLADGNKMEIGRLAQFFTAPSEWGDVMRYELPCSADKAAFLTSAVWATYAARDRLKERIATLLIPHYKDLVIRYSGSAAQFSVDGGGGVDFSKKENTYRILERLLKWGKEHRVHFCFVAYPTRPREDGSLYQVDPRYVKLIAAFGMVFIDTRTIDSLPRDMYVDELHLNPEGRERYSHELAQRLVPLMPVN
jgi:hypothetical protein